MDSEVISLHLSSEITGHDIPQLLLEICPKCRVWMHLEDGQSKQWITADVKKVARYRQHVVHSEERM